MEIKITDEFASAMQQLSAEAEETLPANSRESRVESAEQFAQILEEFRALNGRMTALEETVADRLKKPEGAEPTDLAQQFQKMDEHMIALRSTETVNQRLFDSLHEELIRYRDNLENATHSLLEILHRMEVSEIEPKEMVERALHRVVSYEPADFAEDDGRIVMRVRRGFLWRDQVLRPEEVVAKRFG